MSGILEYPRITHDHFFKKLMSRDEVMRDFLEEYLPGDLLSSVDLCTLKYLSTDGKGYTKDNRYPDVAVQMGFKKGEGHLIVLVEHQSSVDVLMPLRLSEYACQLSRQYLRDHKVTRLPWVYPIVVHQGVRAYCHPQDIRRLIVGPDLQEKRGVLQTFHLIDLSQTPESALKRRPWSGILLLTLKRVFSKNHSEIKEVFDQMAALYQQPELQELAHFMVEYFSENSRVRDPQRLYKMAEAHLIKSTGGSDMGFYREILEKGAAQGMQQGMQQGVQLGEELGKRKVVKSMLAHQLSEQVIRDVTDLDISTIHKIRDEMKSESSRD